MARWRSAIFLGWLAVGACSSDDTPAPDTTPGGGTSTPIDGGTKNDARPPVEEVPDATTSSRDPSAPLRVFVTSASFTGALDGLSGADTKCATAAAKLTPAGKWVAWLSVPGGEGASTRVIAPGGTLPYQLLDGKQLAASAKDVLTKGILRAINLDETGATAPDTASAWTATLKTGEAKPNACLGWTNGAAEHKGDIGHPSVMTDDWTAFATADGCSAMNRLYCFEIP